MRALAAALIALAACSADSAPEPDHRQVVVETSPDRAPAAAALTPMAKTDPQAPAPAAAPVAEAAGPGDPGGFHLDDPTVEYQVGRRPTDHKGKPIELLLRSTPPGAVAAVDGEAVGPTPAIWQGTTSGRAVDFTFVLPGYATARYRFVPMQSGVVHGSLERLKLEELDAGPP